MISRNKNIIEKVPYKGRNSAITVLFAFLFQVDTLPNEGSVVERSRAHWSRASLTTLYSIGFEPWVIIPSTKYFFTKTSKIT